MATKLHLISLLKKEVRKFQKLQIVHGDISINNMIIDQSANNNSNFTLKLIDFGNCYIFSYEKLTNEDLVPNLRPP